MRIFRVHVANEALRLCARRAIKLAILVLNTVTEQKMASVVRWGAGAS